MGGITCAAGRAAKISTVALAATASLSLTAAPALAGGNGSQGQTINLHGGEVYDQVVSDLLPQPGAPTVPGGCWFPGDADAFMSTYGNAVQHFTANKAQDFWFTSTYTGDAAVYPIVFVALGVPAQDENQNDVLDTSGSPLATGHLTIWFGQSDNNQNGVQHATLTFRGSEADGTPVELQGHFQFAVNANGQPTGVTGAISCSPEVS